MPAGGEASAVMWRSTRHLSLAVLLLLFAAGETPSPRHLVDGVDLGEASFGPTAPGSDTVHLHHGTYNNGDWPIIELRDVVSDRVSGSILAVARIHYVIPATGYDESAQAFVVRGGRAVWVGEVGSYSYFNDTGPLVNPWYFTSFMKDRFFVDRWDNEQRCDRRGPWVRTTYTVRGAKLAMLARTHHHRAGEPPLAECRSRPTPNPQEPPPTPWPDPDAPLRGPATPAFYTVTFNGRPVLRHARALVAGGHVFFPLHDVAAATASWIVLSPRWRSIEITRGRRQYGTGIGTEGRVVHGHAYVLLRAATAGLGEGLAYDARTRTIAIAARPRIPDPYSGPHERPADGGTVDDPYPIISMWFQGVKIVRPVHVTVDDVEAPATVFLNVVSSTPLRALAPGAHRIKIAAAVARGGEAGAGWSFQVSARKTHASPSSPQPNGTLFVQDVIQPGAGTFDVWLRIPRGIEGGSLTVEGTKNSPSLEPVRPDLYVAHVVVSPPLKRAIDAHVAAELLLLDGTRRTLVMPETVRLEPARVQGRPP